MLTRSGKAVQLVIAIAVAGTLAACTTLTPAPPGISKRVSWSALPGWQDDDHAAAWIALLESCERLSARDDSWQAICRDAEVVGVPDDQTARAFFETRFVPHRVVGERGQRKGLITGYYEPLLDGSLVQTERFRYPLYRRPANLLTIDLGTVYPELQGRPVRGRLQGMRVVPYYSRAEIDNSTSPLSGHEIAWVDDPVDLFFLHVQGSGRIRLQDGETLAVGYADQNGHPYISIGRRLLQMAELEQEEVNLDSIRNWLAAHPDALENLLNSNPSYIFFAVRDSALPGPLGSLRVPLTAERSLAVDPRYVPLGSPVWLDTTLPDERERYRRLMFAQDTGGAIKGPLRADVFFGQGREAERLAGRMKQTGRLFVLLPAQRERAGFR
ncbi:MAG: murein transglycosylase A [Acidiferrobacterales bacterium]